MTTCMNYESLNNLVLYSTYPLLQLTSHIDNDKLASIRFISVVLTVFSYLINLQKIIHGGKLTTKILKLFVETKSEIILALIEYLHIKDTHLPVIPTSRLPLILINNLFFFYSS